jgi:dTDP-4-dehydrorhamnose 3,5-epimerase
MRFTETPLAGAFIVDIEPQADERGFFARSWCDDEFARHGLDARMAQCNISFNRRRGTVRGLHYQAAPHTEAKLVRCTQGGAWDVIVDLRPDSPTRGRWTAVELSATNRRMLFVPHGFAHGFQTLEDDTELFYQMSERYQAGLERGLRWDDPALAIAWPIPEPIISQRDRELPTLREGGGRADLT